MAYTIDRHPCEDSPRLGAMTLHPEPESVPRARRWFRKFIAPYNPACSIDDCTLMISELVTNAIRYGRSDDSWVVRVEWYREGTSLRVDVHNPGFPANVRLRHPEANDAHGRGLLLVDSIATPGTPGPATSAGRSSPSWSPMPGRRDVVGLPGGFRFYDLRHTGHTLCTRSGPTLKTRWSAPASPPSRRRWSTSTPTTSDSRKSLQDSTRLSARYVRLHGKLLPCQTRQKSANSPRGKVSDAWGTRR